MEMVGGGGGVWQQVCHASGHEYTLVMAAWQLADGIMKGVTCLLQLLFSCNSVTCLLRGKLDDELGRNCCCQRRVGCDEGPVIPPIRLASVLIMCAGRGGGRHR